MELGDKGFAMTAEEWKILGFNNLRPETMERVEYPLAKASKLLECAEQRRNALRDADVSEYPAGDRREAFKQQVRNQQALLENIITVVTPYLPSVADGAEAFLSE